MRKIKVLHHNLGLTHKTQIHHKIFSNDAAASNDNTRGGRGDCGNYYASQD